MKDKLKRKIDSKRLSMILAIIGASLLLMSFVWSLFLEGNFLLRQHEKIVLEGVKNYFLHYPTRLPEKVGDYTKLSLNDLYQQKFIDPLLVPKSNTHTCSVENSWIRVFKDSEKDDGYSYYIYLECGKYHSNIDHVGPEITLEGEDTIYLGIGEKYQELGVQRVVDNRDGEIDKNMVIIDSTHLNINEVGDYQVKYTVYDQLKNRSDKVRTVSVRRHLKEEVVKNTGSSHTYQGNVTNNYVLFSGLTWRIVKMNEDQTIQLVSEDSLAVLPYGNASHYQDSNISSWLNTYFYPLLKNKEFVKEDSVWCLDGVDTNGNIKECSSYSSLLAVGTVSLPMYQNSYDASGQSYLQTQMLYWLADSFNEEEGYTSSKFQGNFNTYQKSRLMGVRAVINIYADRLFITGGKGTQESPYQLNDMSYGKDNDSLNQRYVGEYVYYSGQMFRIAGFDEVGNTKLVGVTNLLNSSTSYPIVSEYQHVSGTLKFRPKEEGNIGYELNQKWIHYLDERLIVEHIYQIPNFDVSRKWNEVETEEIVAKISIPATSEIFSGQNSDEQYVKYNYWLSDFVPNDNHFIMVNSANGLGFDVTTSDFSSNAFKIMIYLSQNAKISSGNGTNDKPYYVK